MEGLHSHRIPHRTESAASPFSDGHTCPHCCRLNRCYDLSRLIPSLTLTTSGFPKSSLSRHRHSLCRCSLTGCRSNHSRTHTCASTQRPADAMIDAGAIGFGYRDSNRCAEFRFSSCHCVGSGKCLILLAEIGSTYSHVGCRESSR